MELDRHGRELPSLPTTRQELAQWIRLNIPLPDATQDLLCTALDAVVARQEQLWQGSKEEAIRAMSQGFGGTLARLREQLAAKDATVNNISAYFENLISTLNEKAGRDAKTSLLNFQRFEEALSILLSTERRGRRCAIGLIDIAHFKWYNDNCGHIVGDRIIDECRRCCANISAIGISSRRSQAHPTTAFTPGSAATNSVS